MKKHVHSKKYENFIKGLLLSPSVNLGCGSFKIADVNIDVEGTVSPDIIWDLNKFPYPFREKVYKSVLLHHSLEHLENPYKVLSECVRILQDDGRIIIVVPSPQNPRYRMENHKQFFTRNSLKNLVSKYFSNVP
ncbi:MAG: class I SAM-dependent methyltransferase [Candidatus Aenigmarchaeota archaeon]|nr:class I SAM-dependent methyltransferase [Candidatus Aenigmarchaeota archaeon]